MPGRCFSAASGVVTGRSSSGSPSLAPSSPRCHSASLVRYHFVYAYSYVSILLDLFFSDCFSVWWVSEEDGKNSKFAQRHKQ